MEGMDKTQKFYSDIQRIKKYNRSGDNFNMGNALRDIEKLFVNSNPACGGLCRSLFDFWKNAYASGADLDDTAVEKITALNSFVNVEDGVDALDAGDWERVKDEVNYAAEDLPLETLGDMMRMVVDYGLI